MAREVLKCTAILHLPPSCARRRCACCIWGECRRHCCGGGSAGCAHPRTCWLARRRITSRPPWTKRRGVLTAQKKATHVEPECQPGNRFERARRRTGGDAGHHQQRRQREYPWLFPRTASPGG